MDDYYDEYYDEWITQQKDQLWEDLKLEEEFYKKGYAYD